jgi:hypothetical protein
VPIPIPADLVMFTVGDRVAAGAFPLWLVVAGFEVVSIIGTTVLFLACRARRTGSSPGSGPGSGSAGPGSAAAPPWSSGAGAPPLRSGGVPP